MASRAQVTRRVSVVTAVIALVAAGLSAVSSSAQAAPASCPQPVSIRGQAVPHVTCASRSFRTQAQTQPAAGQNPAADPGHDMTSHGGKVMTAPVAYNVFWLPAGTHFESDGLATSDTAYENLLNRFFNNVGNSDLMRIMTQYTGSNGTPALAPTIRLAGSYVDTTAYPHAGTAAAPLTDGDIQAAATRAATANSWTKDINHIYMIYTAFGIDECDGAGNCNYPATADSTHPTSGFNYCAYHNYFSGDPTVFAFMGDDASEQYGTSGCSIGSAPNGDAAADSEVSTASHEYFEATTDPQLDGWFNVNTAGEIGDLCAYNTGPTGAVNSIGADIYLGGSPYAIQQEWSNAIHGCSNDVNDALNSDVPPVDTTTKTGPSSAVTGQTITYSLTVNNPSDTNASALTVVSDPLPSNESYVAGSASVSPTSTSPLTWNLGMIAVHDSVTITFQAKVLHATSTQNCASTAFDDEYQLSSHTSANGCSTVSVTPASTTMTLTSSVNPSVFAQSVQFDATVTSNAPGSGTPLGTITITDNGNPLASLTNTNTLSVATSALSVGSHTIVATFAGNSDYNSSSDTITQVVNRQPTTTTVVCVPPTSHVNQAVTCTATVSPTIPNATSVTGTVDFFEDGSLTSAHTSTVSSGQAAWQTTFGGGSHTVVAVYNGDTNYAPSTSSSAPETVLCDTTITGTHSSLIVTHGTTCVLNAHITGGITVAPGAVLDVENSVVSGSISADAPAAFRVCGSSTGAITVSKSTGFVLIGDPANNCAANTISGSVMVANSHNGVVIVGNTVSSSVSAVGDSGTSPLGQPVTVSGNHH